MTMMIQGCYDNGDREAQHTLSYVFFSVFDSDEDNFKIPVYIQLNEEFLGLCS